MDSARTFSDFEAKSCSPKNTTKNSPKGAPKKSTKNRNVFTAFSTEFFPEFSVCVCVFICSKNHKCHRKWPPKNSPRNSIAAQNEIQSADVAKLETSQYASLRTENDPEKPKFLQLAVLHTSAYQCRAIQWIACPIQRVYLFFFCRWRLPSGADRDSGRCVVKMLGCFEFGRPQIANELCSLSARMLSHMPESCAIFGGICRALFLGK